MIVWPHALGQNILEAGVGVREASSLLFGRKKLNEEDVDIHLAFYFSHLILELGAHGMVLLHLGWIFLIS